MVVVVVVVEVVVIVRPVRLIRERIKPTEFSRGTRAESPAMRVEDVGSAHKRPLVAIKETIRSARPNT